MEAFERAVTGFTLLVEGGLVLLAVAFVTTASGFLPAGFLTADGSSFFTTFLSTAGTVETFGRFMAGSIAFCIERKVKLQLLYEKPRVYIN